MLLYARSIFTGTPLPPPTLPYIRSLVPSPIPSQVTFHDRTYTEWMGLCREWEGAPGSLGVNEAAAALRVAFYASQRARWLARCYFRHLRMRIARRRSSHGEDDMVTCAPIPPISLVSVYDFRNRSHYTFHSQTILNTILHSLQYSQYGIACPSRPKNPYTNVVWNIGQLTSILGQCAVATMRTRHRSLPSILVGFRNAQYSVARFHRNHRETLGVDAAVRFFSHHREPEVQLTYSDIIDDLYDELANGEPAFVGMRPAKNLIKGRRLPESLQSQWDCVVIALWIHDNLNLLYGGYHSYNDIMEDVVRLHAQTLFHVRRPVVIVAAQNRVVMAVAAPVAVNSLAPVEECCPPPTPT